MKKCVVCGKKAELFEFLKEAKGEPIYQALCSAHKHRGVKRPLHACGCGPVFFPKGLLNPKTRLCVFCEDLPHPRPPHGKKDQGI